MAKEKAEQPKSAEEKIAESISAQVIAKWPELGELEEVPYKRPEVDSALVEAIGITEQEAQNQTQEFGLRLTNDDERYTFMGWEKPKPEDEQDVVEDKPRYT